MLQKQPNFQDPAATGDQANTSDASIQSASPHSVQPDLCAKGHRRSFTPPGAHRRDNLPIQPGPDRRTVLLWAGGGRDPRRRCSVRTKPGCVLAERKLLTRLDGVCRHYLAMTKSALFLFTGWKIQHGPVRNASSNQLCTPEGFFLSFFFDYAVVLLFAFVVLFPPELEPGTPKFRQRCVDHFSASFSRCFSDRKTEQLWPN